MKGKPSKLNISLEKVKEHIKPGPARIMVRIIPNTPATSALDIPDICKDKAEAEIRTCEVLKAGLRIKLPLIVGDRALIMYRPTQKLWDTIETTDGHKVAFLPEEMFIGAIWNTSLT